MRKLILILFLLTPVSLFGQLLGNGKDVMMIFQMNSLSISERMPDKPLSSVFEKHSLSANDSLLFTVLNDSLLTIVDPNMIKEVIVIKNSDLIKSYTNESLTGLVIVKFKKEEQFFKIITNSNNY